MQRQGEIAGQSVKQFQDLASFKPSSASVRETLVKQIDLTKTSYEKNVADARELGDIVAKVGTEAADILSRRVVASLDEVKALSAPKQPSWMKSRRRLNPRQPVALPSLPDTRVVRNLGRSGVDMERAAIPRLFLYFRARKKPVWSSAGLPTSSAQGCSDSIPGDLERRLGDPDQRLMHVAGTTAHK